MVISSGTKSPYEGQWKISDFGISSIRATTLAPEEDANTSALDALPHPGSQELPLDGIRHSSLDTNETIDSDAFTKETCSRSHRKYDVWSLGCIFIEVLTWITKGSEGITQFAPHRPKLRPKHQRPISQCRLHSETAKCKFFEAEYKASKTREELLERLAGMPESVTKSIAESVIAPMLEPPDENYSWRKIRDKARAVLSDCWVDYKKAIARAATPLFSLVRPMSKDHFLSSTRATDGEDSAETGSIVSRVDKDPNTSHVVKDELREDTDFDPNISTKSSCYSYSIERYLRDKSDYNALVYIGASSADLGALKELHKVYLESVIDTLKRFDDAMRLSSEE